MVFYKKLQAELITTTDDTNTLHSVVRIMGDTIPAETDPNISTALFEVMNNNTNVKANPLEIKGGPMVFNKLNSDDETSMGVPNTNKGYIYIGTDNSLYFKDDDGNEFSLAGAGGGKSGSVVSNYICAEIIATNKIVAVDSSGKIVIAEKGDSAKIEVAGFSIEAGAIASTVRVQKIGALDGFTGLTAGLPCFLGDAGNVIQDDDDISSGEYRVYLGIANSTTVVDIDVGEATENDSDYTIYDLIVKNNATIDKTLTVGDSLTVNGKLVTGDVFSKIVFPTGSSDDVILQAANDALTNGGTIQLAEGDTTFVLDTPVVISGNVTIQGTRSRGSRITGQGFQIGDSGDSAIARSGVIGCWFENVDNGYCIDVNTGASMVYDNTFYNNMSGARAGDTSFPAINIRSTANRTRVINNYAEDNGNLIDRGNCESATSPMIFGETVPLLNHVTFNRSGSGQGYEGDYSRVLTKTVAAGTLAYAALTDNFITTDMHGMVAGLTYKLYVRIYINSGNMLGSEAIIQIQDYAAGAWAGQDGIAVNTYDEWQEVTTERTIRAAATGVRIILTIQAAAANAEYFYVDNIRLQPVGINNEHGQQFQDAGTNTYIS